MIYNILREVENEFVFVETLEFASPEDVVAYITLKHEEEGVCFGANLVSE